jgi:hypothetical protein
VSTKDERDRIRAQIDFGDLGTGFETRLPEPPVAGHASPELEAGLRTLIRQPLAAVESYRFQNWAAAGLRRALRAVLDDDDVLVATTEADPSMILRSIHQDAGPLCSALQSPKFWGERMEFREVGSGAVPAWGAERPGFSYVVVASAGQYVLLLEGDRAALEPILDERLGALLELSNGEATR